MKTGTWEITLDLRGRIGPKYLLLVIKQLNQNAHALRSGACVLLVLTDCEHATTSIPETANSMGYRANVTMDKQGYRIRIESPANSLCRTPSEAQHQCTSAVHYIRTKVDQLLAVLGTDPAPHREMEDIHLLDPDPIGTIADAFYQMIDHLKEANRALRIAQQETRAMIDALPAAIIVLDQDDNLEDLNREAADWFFGGRRDAILHHPIQEVCTFHVELQCAAAGDHELMLNERHFQVVASEIRDESGRKTKTIFALFDVTRRKALEAGMALYAKTFEHAAEGIFITDEATNILQVNEAFTRITGYAREELLGCTPRTFKSGLHDANFYGEMWRNIRECGYWKGEILNRVKSGNVIPLLQTISEVRDGNGVLTNYISVVTDITYLKATESRLDFLAHHDALTELPNRLLLDDRLNQAIWRAERKGTIFALLFVDLDRFKNINDSFGHPAGDCVLVEVARRLRSLLRRSDTLARIGGDEFVILTERLKSPRDAEHLAAKVVATLKQPVVVHQQIFHIGCSIGITLYPEDGNDAMVLLKNADAAMYRVKESGRDSYSRFCRERGAAPGESSSLETALRAAVEHDHFVLYYQPIVDFLSRRVIAAEALLRWPMGDEFVPPDKFIPLAEEHKLIGQLGARVAARAFAQLQTWRKAGIALDYVAINVSGAQIVAPGFADELITILSQYKLPGRCVQVELTENVLMRDLETCSRVLNRLRRRGIRIAIDDFGTGYSSLVYLSQLPIDSLKLDRSFVRELPANPHDCAIARAVIGLAQNLGIESLAEGIEEEAQERYLTEIGCHKVQGYRYGTPLPPEQFVEALGRYKEAMN